MCDRIAERLKLAVCRYGRDIGPSKGCLRVRAFDVLIAKLNIGPLSDFSLDVKVVEDVENGALGVSEPHPFLGEVFQDVNDSSLNVIAVLPLVGEVIKDIEDRAGVAPRVNEGALIEHGFIVRIQDHHSRSFEFDPFFSSLICFLSSIIFSSRPTVNCWNRSSSANLSSSRPRCSAISASALFCAVTSRAAANTPSTPPLASL